jgi:hypothetical protein
LPDSGFLGRVFSWLLARKTLGFEKTQTL